MVFYLVGFVLGVGYFVQVFFKEYSKSVQVKQQLIDREYTEVHERTKFYGYYLLLICLSVFYLIIEYPKEGTALWVGIAVFLVLFSLAKILTVRNQFTMYDFGSSFLYGVEVYHYKNFEKDIDTTGFFLKEVKIRDTDRTMLIFKKAREKIARMVNK